MTVPWDRTIFRPELIASNAFVAPNATLLGEVLVGNEACVLFGAVLRGDCEPISIGDESNIQDHCCLHADPGFPCVVGRRVTVGHGAIIHGATVEDECLIGIRAILLNGSVIGTGSIIAAGALIPEGKIIPPHSLVMGMPGKVVRQVGPDDRVLIERGWQHYVETANAYRTSLASGKTSR
ncbi:gamma carbonic anhydrase family protein [Pirellulaceae bacterium SH467]|jgi:carbonic anhydrase/acetyltransferase-like protein (isoleucine patch superfamily)